MTDQEKELKKKKEVKEYCTIFKTKIKLVPFSFLITKKKVFGRLHTFFFSLAGHAKKTLRVCGETMVNGRFCAFSLRKMCIIFMAR